MQLIDTHVHINFKSLATDLGGIRQRWRSAGVVSLVHSCVHPGEFAEIRAIADQVEQWIESGLSLEAILEKLPALKSGGWKSPDSNS